ESSRSRRGIPRDGTSGRGHPGVPEGVARDGSPAAFVRGSGRVLRGEGAVSARHCYIATRDTGDAGRGRSARGRLVLARRLTGRPGTEGGGIEALREGARGGL